MFTNLKSMITEKMVEHLIDTKNASITISFDKKNENDEDLNTSGSLNELIAEISDKRSINISVGFNAKEGK